MEISTPSVRSLRSEHWVTEIENTLGKADIDILGISEVWLGEEKIICRKSGFIFRYYGTTFGHWGIGFLIKYNLKGSIVQKDDIMWDGRMI